jgi:hypothetical protein
MAIIEGRDQATWCLFGTYVLLILLTCVSCSTVQNDSSNSDGNRQAFPVTLTYVPGSSSAIVPIPLQPAHRGTSMAIKNELCENCHQEVALEWRTSLHRNSWKEPAFQRAFRREPSSFCQGCHAPEADPKQPVPAALATMGTGCVSCHLVGDDTVLASRSSKPRGSAPHKVVRDGRLDDQVACAGCHEFAFPEGSEPWGPSTPMQPTVTEYRNSPAHGQGCASCHMPKVDRSGHRNHSFASSRDASRMQAAVKVIAHRIEPTTVEITLISKVRGHKFPTGDLFRRLEVLVEAISPYETLLAQKRVYLGRHFPWKSPAPGMAARRTIGLDNRLTEVPRTLTLDLGPSAVNAKIRYRISYQRVSHPVSDHDSEAVVERAIILASGEFAKPN